MLHGDGKFATYLIFFTTVCATLNGEEFDTAEVKTADCAAVGSDEEIAHVNAMKSLSECQARVLFATLPKTVLSPNSCPTPAIASIPFITESCQPTSS